MFLLIHFKRKIIVSNLRGKWEQRKKLHVFQLKKKYEADSLVEDFELTEITLIKVIEETDQIYRLEVLKENLAVLSAKEFDETIGEKLPKYKYTRFLYELNKSTNEYKLLNWEEAKNSVDESFVELEKVFEGTDNEGMASLISLIISPQFLNEEMTVEYMKNEIGFLFVPFSSEFTLNDTISITQTDKNPFNPSQNLSVYTHLILQNVEDNTATFTQEKEMDMSEILEMMKSMMLSMVKSMTKNSSEEEKQAKIKEIEEMEMEMTNKQIITFDIKSSWATHVEMQTRVSGSDPQRGKQLKISSYKSIIE